MCYSKAKNHFDSGACAPAKVNLASPVYVTSIDQTPFFYRGESSVRLLKWSITIVVKTVYIWHLTVFHATSGITCNPQTHSGLRLSYYSYIVLTDTETN